jgi:predicted permease
MGPRLQTFFDETFEKVKHLEGVTDAAVNSNLPFHQDSGYFVLPFHTVGQPESQLGREPTLVPQAISANYFKTMEIPLLRGRDFDAQDRREHQNVMIIDKAFADHFFPSEDPIGKEIEFRGSFDIKRNWTIVGIVGASLHNHPDNDRAIPVQAYFPCQQSVVDIEWLILRSTANPGELFERVQKTIASVDPGVVATDCVTFDQLIDSKYVARKLTVILVSIFSCASLLLSAVGTYALLAYLVEQRRRDLGIRIALGAGRSRIVKLVVLGGIRLACIGVAVGLVLTLVSLRWIGSVLYGVSLWDPVTICGAILLVIASTTVACLIPALQAVRTNPNRVLRES